MTQLMFKPGKYKTGVPMPNIPVCSFIIRLYNCRMHCVNENKGKGALNDIVQTLGKLNRSFTLIKRTELGWAHWFNSMEIQDMIGIIMIGKESKCHNTFMREWDSIKSDSVKIIANGLTVH